LQLERDGGMLFAPEVQKLSGQPAAVGAEFVHDRMARRTDGDQPFRAVDAGLPVMHGALIPCPAALAPVPVALQNRLALPGKAAQRMPELPVTGGAQPGNHRRAAAAGAKQRALRKIRYKASIAGDNLHYHQLIE
jgi:hypothetical protein